MKPTVTFSTGHSATYGGTREVKAAWIITSKDRQQKLATGFSLDADRAEATAKNNATSYGQGQCNGQPLLYVPETIMMFGKENAKNNLAKLKAAEADKMGINWKRRDGKATISTIYEASKQYNRLIRETFRNSVYIEVVTL